MDLSDIHRYLLYVGEVRSEREDVVDVRDEREREEGV